MVSHTANNQLWLDMEKELTELRAYKQACEQQEAAVTVRKEPDYWSGGHFHEGSKPYIYFADIASLPIGTKLFRNPDPQAAQLRMRVVEQSNTIANLCSQITDLKAQLAIRLAARMRVQELKDRYECNTAIMHARTAKMNEYGARIAEVEAQLATRDQQVADACAELAEDYNGKRGEHDGTEIGHMIRSSEWKNHMKGVE